MFDFDVRFRCSILLGHALTLVGCGAFLCLSSYALSCRSIPENVDKFGRFDWFCVFSSFETTAVGCIAPSSSIDVPAVFAFSSHSDSNSSSRRRTRMWQRLRPQPLKLISTLLLLLMPSPQQAGKAGLCLVCGVRASHCENPIRSQTKKCAVGSN